MTKYFKNSDICILQSNNETKPNFWLNTLIIDNLNYENRNNLINILNKKGFEVRPIWKLLNTLRQFKNCPKSDLKNALYIKNKIINLPSGYDIYKNIKINK